MGALKIEELPHYTYEDYTHWEGRWEIIHGIAYAMSPTAMINHQIISNKVASELTRMFQECDMCSVLLPVDWKISDDTIVRPDNSVICYEPKNDAYITKSPMMIFEILSKSTFKKDTSTKFDLYEKEGVLYYVIVDPDDKVAKVYELREGKYVKIKDATDENVLFEGEGCEVKFDFGAVFN